MDIHQIKLSEEQNTFYFIQQALSKINEAAQNYTAVDATIWLTKGDHYFFYCDKLVQYAPDIPVQWDTTQYDYTSLKEDILCSLDSMHARYPKTDNVNLVIRSYSCDSIEAKSTDQAKFDLAWFYSKCSDLKNTQTDERAVVYVNGPEFYFNITKQALFKDIIFDGINAFSQYRT